MQKKILIIDDYDDLKTALSAEFGKIGHAVESAGNRADGLKQLENGDFDVIISDLDGGDLMLEENTNRNLEGSTELAPNSRSSIKAFRVCIPSFQVGKFSEAELKECVETILKYKSKYIDRDKALIERHEKIEFEIPSMIALMHSVMDYLVKRVEKIGVVNPERSNLFVALDEAFVNAVKHGNKFNAEKRVRVIAEITPKEARFTIEDEGEGFDVSSIPDPTDTENLFKASGRGVMFMYNIMDEVIFNDRGNRITMVKKSDNPT